MSELVGGLSSPRTRFPAGQPPGKAAAARWPAPLGIRNMLQDFRRRPLADDPPVNRQPPGRGLAIRCTPTSPDPRAPGSISSSPCSAIPRLRRGLWHSGTARDLGYGQRGPAPEGALYGYSYSFSVGRIAGIADRRVQQPRLFRPGRSSDRSAGVGPLVTGYLTQTTTAAKVFPQSPTWDRCTSLAATVNSTACIDAGRLAAVRRCWLCWNSRTARTRRQCHPLVRPQRVAGRSATFYTRMTDPYSSRRRCCISCCSPTAAAPTDPRPTCPTVFVDSPAGRMIAHGDWSPNGAISTIKRLEHHRPPEPHAGQFEFYRNGDG